MATQTGIWKPRHLNAALSFRTVFAKEPSQRPYNDKEGPDGFLRYKWRFTDPTDPNNYNLSDNRAMREAMRQRFPLIWFQGVAPGLYMPVYPVYLADEEPEFHQFVVALDVQSLQLREDLELDDPALVRSYAERVVNERLHQPLFRERVLRAYRSSCSICQLRHTRLLDAAHVLPDSAGGEPSLPMELLCARSTMLHMTQTFSGSRPATGLGFAQTSWMNSTALRSVTRCRLSTALLLNAQAGELHGPIRSS